MTVKQSDAAAGEQLERGDRRHKATAAEKIQQTLREISKPEPGADGMQLTLATVAMGLEAQLGDELEQRQATGELDEFVLALTRFLAMHASDSAEMLLVVKMPRRDPPAPEIPPGAKLHRLDEAWRAAAVGVPW